MNNKTPARSNVVVLKQILNLIPRGIINRHALETGVEGNRGQSGVSGMDGCDCEKERQVISQVNAASHILGSKYMIYDFARRLRGMPSIDSAPRRHATLVARLLLSGCMANSTAQV